MAFLGRRRVFGQKLYDVRVVVAPPCAASTDDVHDAGQHVAGGAAETASTSTATHLLFLTRFQDLQGTIETSSITCSLGHLCYQGLRLTLKTRLSMCISFSCFRMWTIRQ